MRVLIKEAHIVAPSQPENGSTRSVLIENGIIKKIADHLEVQADKIISFPNLHVSPGWMDPFVHFCDPGQEYKETLTSGADAAAAGGYTTVFTLPNTTPSLDTRTQIEYIIRRSEQLCVNIYPIGAMSQSTKGENLAEMYDMYTAGAKAFSDGIHPIANSGLMLKALQYVKAFNGTIIQIPEDPEIAQDGWVHEGSWSTKLGISGKPNIAELMMIKRDLDLLRYSESKLHLTGISLAESIELIKAAKEEGLPISCSVTPYNLVLTDEKLKTFDSHYKLTPPLREEKDVKIIKEALKEGIIDCVATHHIPQDKDSKDREFEYAEDGMIGLETAFGILRTSLPELEIEKLINILAIKSRAIFGMEVPKMKEGEKAELTLFDPEKEWKYNSSKGKSKAHNTPFNNYTFKGKPLGIINNNSLFINK